MAKGACWTRSSTKAEGEDGVEQHLITIYHAVLMGLPVSVEELRAAMDDDEGLAGNTVPLPGWQQRAVAL